MLITYILCVNMLLGLVRFVSFVGSWHFLLPVTGCKKYGKSRSVTVDNGHIKSHKNPEDGHHPNCKLIPDYVHQLTSLDRRMRAEVRQKVKSPRDAFSDMIASIPKQFKDSADQDLITKNVPTYNNVSRQLRRHRQAVPIPVSNLQSIPEHAEDMRINMRGREAIEESPYQEKRFLSYTGQKAWFTKKLNGTIWIFWSKLCSTNNHSSISQYNLICLRHRNLYIYNMYNWML